MSEKAKTLKKAQTKRLTAAHHGDHEGAALHGEEQKQNKQLYRITYKVGCLFIYNLLYSIYFLFFTSSFLAPGFSHSWLFSPLSFPPCSAAPLCSVAAPW